MTTPDDAAADDAATEEAVSVVEEAVSADEAVSVQARTVDDIEVVEIDTDITVEQFQPHELPAQAVSESEVAAADDVLASYAADADVPGAVTATQLDVLDVEPTGDPRVDDALDRLRDLAGLPTADHVEVYEDVHRRVQRALADLDPDD